MAFRILTDKEIGRLNAEEKAAYEAEYADYMKRAAFVERLERQAEMKMPEVHPTRVKVRRIRPAEVKKPAFADKPEITAISSDKLAMSLSSYNRAKREIKLSPLSMSALPFVAVPSSDAGKKVFGSVSVKRTEKVPVPNAEIISFHADEPVVSIGKIQQAEVPTVDIKLDKNSIKPSIPSVTVPSSVNVENNIPPVSVQGIPDLVVVSPDGVNINIDDPVVEKTVLSAVTPPEIAFTAPDLHITAVAASVPDAPVTADINIPEYSVSPTAHVVADAPSVELTMPEIGKRKVSVKEISSPEIHRIDTSVNVDISRLSCVIAECPDVSGISLGTLSVNKPDKVKYTEAADVSFTPPEKVVVENTKIVEPAVPFIDKDAFLNRIKNISR